MVQESYRILRPGGAFAIINFDPREHRYDWVVYTYFEGIYETDLERFPAMAEQEEMLRQAGLRQVSSPVVQYIEDDQTGETILDSYYLQKGSSSQLILLSDEAYQVGLDRIRAKIAEAKAKGEKIVFRTQLNNRMCHGFKPGYKNAEELST